MTPFETAARWFISHHPPQLFPQLIEAHAQHGQVIITPELFLLFRPVEHWWDAEDLTNPWRTSGKPDCYHVFLAAGNLKKIHRFFPSPLPFISFHRRRHRLVIVPWESFVRKLHSAPAQ